MNIQGIGGGYTPQNTANKPNGQNNSSNGMFTQAVDSDKPKASDKVQEFLNYMKQTPAQRLEEDWLKQHGLTREKLAAMSPEEREKVMAQMKEEIQQQMKQNAENKVNGKTDILA
jgi:hypothetical protein